MKLVDHWLDYHHFHHEDVVEFTEILKKGWESVLFTAMTLMLIYTVLVMISPDLAYDISRYLL